MVHVSRRQWLRQTSLGFGSLALTGLMAEQSSAGPLSPRVGHVPARAKRVIFLFMQGGQSQMDLYDPKPKLRALDGQPVDKKKPKGQRYKGSPHRFRAHGQSGLELSEVWSHFSEHADDLCVVRSMATDSANHSNAMLQFHTGAQNFVRPSIGSWVTYGLGTESSSLPGFITLRPTRGHGSRVYSSAFLPSIFQGTPLGNDRIPAKQINLPHLQNAHWTSTEQREMLDFTQSMNADFSQTAGATPEMDGLIQSYERAFRLQTEATQLFDLSSEPQHVRDMYGVDNKATDDFGRSCLLARRFAEAGVRYIQVNDGGWDHHSRIDKSLPRACRAVDKPIAGLLTDLKQRGMLDDTLVVCSGEFGRTTAAEGAIATAGRGHNSRAFSIWMAGGGTRGGLAYGTTDELGGKVVADRVHIHDLHATLLHLMGLDHEQLTYNYHGRDFRLTDVYGKVVDGVLA